MPKLTAVSTEPPSSVDLAERNLADLRNRAAEIDRRGEGLLADLRNLEQEAPRLALDVLEDEARQP